MGRRLSTEVTATDPLFEEMLERDPPVIDGIKLATADIDQILAIADTVGVNGSRIVELLGAPKDGGPVEVGHCITQTEQEELLSRLEELTNETEASIETERGLSELACEPDSVQEEVLGERGPEILSVYLKAITIYDLVAFTLEHDIELSIK